MTRRLPRPRGPAAGLAIACALAALFALLGPTAPTALAESPAPAASSAAASSVGPALSAARPPGSRLTPEPSLAIFPAQEIPLRFDHDKHVRDLKLSCSSCHAATTSRSSADRLLPDPVKSCDSCHTVDHRDLGRVVAEAGAEACASCHEGGADPSGQVRRVLIPKPNLHFSHAAHADRSIGCAQCHGDVASTTVATRSELPRMAGCMRCHGERGDSQGDAKSACSTCHLTRPDGVLQTSLNGQRLMPPRWLGGAEHSADWLTRHKYVAGDDSALCGSCHTESECADCHDGRVRPRDVHPGDFLSMHAQAARQDSPRCASCHQAQTFCADCHRRVGIAEDGPSARRATGQRFHPSPAIWTDSPRGPEHHAWAAQKNLSACASCHTERDCTSCHATRGVSGGRGVSPHPVGFVGSCSGPLRQNPRPCLVCHQAGDRSLELCR